MFESDIDFWPLILQNLTAPDVMNCRLVCTKLNNISSAANIWIYLACNSSEYDDISYYFVGPNVSKTKIIYHNLDMKILTTFWKHINEYKKIDNIKNKECSLFVKQLQLNSNDYLLMNKLISPIGFFKIMISFKHWNKKCEYMIKRGNHKGEICNGKSKPFLSFCGKHIIYCEPVQSQLVLNII